jgi:hypothetical protein
MEKSKLSLLIIYSVISIVLMIIIITKFYGTIINEFMGVTGINIIVIFIACVPLAIFLVYLIRSLFRTEKSERIYKAVAKSDLTGILLFIKQFDSMRYIYINQIDKIIKKVIKEHNFEFIFGSHPNSKPLKLEERNKIMLQLQRAINAIEVHFPIKIYPGKNRFFYSCIYEVFNQYSSNFGPGIFEEWMTYFLTNPLDIRTDEFCKNEQNAIDIVASLRWVINPNDGDKEKTILKETINNKIDILYLKLGCDAEETAKVLKRKFSKAIDIRGIYWGEIIVRI